MADENTPTTVEVRERFIDGFPMDTWAVARSEAKAGFNRWLAERIAQAKAEALEEFAQKLYYEYTLNFARPTTLHDQIVWLLRRDASAIREAVQS